MRVSPLEPTAAAAAAAAAAGEAATKQQPAVHGAVPMITFLPCADFDAIARLLDDKRLGGQQTIIITLFTANQDRDDIFLSVQT